MKDLLPIGSVVTLKEGKKKLMIIRGIYNRVVDKPFIYGYI